MENAKVYVGNLPYSATEDDLRALFEPGGAVAEVRIIMDRETGRSKGYAFVTFETEEGATAALEKSGSDYSGRAIRVDRARPSTGGRSGGGGGGGGRGGFGGGGGRGGFGGGGGRGDSRY